MAIQPTGEVSSVVKILTKSPYMLTVVEVWNTLQKLQAHATMEEMSERKKKTNILLRSECLGKTQWYFLKANTEIMYKEAENSWFYKLFHKNRSQVN